MYISPSYITENNNGDVVVSDWARAAVVVTDCRGRYRFSYARNPWGFELAPYGMCTDALSHSLVCDFQKNTVHMLDKDGQFLSRLLIRPSGIFAHYTISYDVNTRCLWVGSLNNNRVCVYRYLKRQNFLTGKWYQLSSSACRIYTKH